MNVMNAVNATNTMNAVNPRVSFIIPVFKVEKYLDQCVRSILIQTFSDFEIILVDDGSPDSSPALCDAWAEADSRVKAFHKPNGGLSDARNFGLGKSSGEYIVFVDGDDFWRDEHCLEELASIAENNPRADFIGFNCEYYYQNSDTFSKWAPYSTCLSSPLSGDEALSLLVSSGTVPMSACFKLMKRSFLVNESLYFAKGITGEDIPWFINLMEHCSSCLFVNLYIYAYRQNVTGSISSTISEKSSRCLFDIFKSEFSSCVQRSFSPQALDALRSFLAYEYCILLGTPLRNETLINQLFEYKDVLKYTMNPKVRLASKVYRAFGIRITVLVLRTYTRLRQLRMKL